jgi:BirA family biotin operon repressor/biotin-[acetyl-CoA-carboxylase] ligase
VIFGSPRRHYRVCDSTNERARELAERGAPLGTVVTAERQSAGRGRQGRRWLTPPGQALLYSAILRPLEARHRLLPLAVGVALCETIEQLTSLRAEIKWPNDVWIERRKCAGVLIEAQPHSGWAVIGVGLNVAVKRKDFPPELRDQATSLGEGVTSSAALSALNQRLGGWAGAEPQRVTDAFAQRDALNGLRVSWQSGEGTADGIDQDGNLLVKGEDGTRLSLGAGEVHLALGRAR